VGAQTQNVCKPHPRNGVFTGLYGNGITSYCRVADGGGLSGRGVVPYLRGIVREGEMCGGGYVQRGDSQRYGSRSFRVSGPTVWNSLPQNLRSSDISREQFKRGLKTWLFERA